VGASPPSERAARSKRAGSFGRNARVPRRESALNPIQAQQAATRMSTAHFRKRNVPIPRITWAAPIAENQAPTLASRALK
jgi:hypothetical protein